MMYTNHHCGKPSGSVALQVDVRVDDLAARAQEHHENYLEGNTVEPDDPEVEDLAVVTGASRSWSGEDRKRSRVVYEEDSEQTYNSEVPMSSKQKRRSKAYSKNKRNALREEERTAGGARDPSCTRPPKRCAQKHKRQALPVHSFYSLPASVADPRAPITRGAFTGKHLKTPTHGNDPVTKEQGLKEHGLDLVEWDGKYVTCRLHCFEKSLISGCVPQKYYCYSGR